MCQNVFLGYKKAFLEVFNQIWEFWKFSKIFGFGQKGPPLWSEPKNFEFLAQLPNIEIRSFPCYLSTFKHFPITFSRDPTFFPFSAAVMQQMFIR